MQRQENSITGITMILKKEKESEIVQNTIGSTGQKNRKIIVENIRENGPEKRGADICKEK